jgi:hypothetical protein
MHEEEVRLSHVLHQKAGRRSLISQTILAIVIGQQV